MQSLPIESLIEVLIDYRGKTPKKTKSGIKLITAKVIKNGTILDTNREYIAEEDFQSWMRRGIPKKGDILITTEAPLGEVAQLKTNEKIALAQRVILLRAKKDVLDENYLLFVLQSDVVQAALKARATGTTVAGIKQSELRQVLLPAPKLDIQRKIGSILSSYNTLIENNTRRIDILEEMAQSIYREWFVKFRFPGHENVEFVDSELGRIPQGWEICKVSEAIQIDPKTTLPKTGEKPFVPMSSISTNSMVISEIELKSGNSGTKFRNGDTLFSRITPCLQNGKIGFVNFLTDQYPTGFGSTEFIVLRSSTKLCPEFVYLLSRTQDFRDHAIKSMTGATGRQRVQNPCFDNYWVATPPRSLVDMFSNVTSSLFSHVFNIDLPPYFETNLK